jgi:hypothetical protein
LAELSNRSRAIRDAMRAVDEMDSERKELSAQHRAKKKLLVAELGLSVDAFDVMRKIQRLEIDEAVGAIRDAYAVLAPGQTVNWLDAFGEPERGQASAAPEPKYRPYEGVSLSLDDAETSKPAEPEGVEIAPPSARRRGRPPGSKNKPRAATAAEIRADHAELAVDGAGTSESNPMWPFPPDTEVAVPPDGHDDDEDVFGLPA